MREDQLDEFFVSPPTPKRNPTHRNYVNRTHIVLTAAERLEEMRLLEEKKSNKQNLRRKKRKCVKFVRKKKRRRQKKGRR
ncbi:AAEL000935-PA [Aedes aegypti]|nr:AAEL000935-PA [Aedes aegypti]